MGMEVKISISIPTYNRLDLLKRCLKSVFNQTVPPDEIIVVDDASSDGTWEYVKKIKGIKAHRNKKNLGMIGNWNESIKLAKNNFVVSLHSDDMLLPNYIRDWKEKIGKLKNKNKIGAFISGGYIVDGSDQVIGFVSNFEKDEIFTPSNVLKKWWQHNYFCIPVTGWTVYNKKIIEEIGYFSTKYRIAAENEMTAKMLLNYPVYYSTTSQFCFRKHGLQGFEGKPKMFNMKQEIENFNDSIKAYLDYGINIEKPVTYMLFLSIANLLIFRFNKFKIYLGLFLTYYPANVLSFKTLSYLYNWFKYSLNMEIKNRRVRRNYKSFSDIKMSIPL